MITTAEIAVALGRTAPEIGSTDQLQWDMWIQKALLLISGGPDGTQSIDVSSLNQVRLDSVVLDAVVAHAQRPDNATQVDVSVDDGRVSKMYKSSAGEITIRPKDWAFLGLAAVSKEAFSTRPGFEPDRTCW